MIRCFALYLRFGPGAGAASAGLLAIMPRSRSMVRRVIAISGSPLAEWAAITDKFRAMNTSLVTIMNYSTPLVVIKMNII